MTRVITKSSPPPRKVASSFLYIVCDVISSLAGPTTIFFRPLQPQCILFTGTRREVAFVSEIIVHIGIFNYFFIEMHLKSSVDEECVWGPASCMRVCVYIHSTISYVKRSSSLCVLSDDVVDSAVSYASHLAGGVMPCFYCRIWLKSFQVCFNFLWNFFNLNQIKSFIFAAILYVADVRGALLKRVQDLFEHSNYVHHLYIRSIFLIATFFPEIHTSFFLFKWFINFLKKKPRFQRIPTFRRLPVFILNLYLILFPFFCGQNMNVDAQAVIFCNNSQRRKIIFVLKFVGLRSDNEIWCNDRQIRTVAAVFVQFFCCVCFISESKITLWSDWFFIRVAAIPSSKLFKYFLSTAVVYAHPIIRCVWFIVLCLWLESKIADHCQV